MATQTSGTVLESPAGSQPKTHASITHSGKKKQMHAAVVEEFGKPLVLREWDIPIAGPVRSNAQQPFIHGRTSSRLHKTVPRRSFKPA